MSVERVWVCPECGKSRLAGERRVVCFTHESGIVRELVPYVPESSLNLKKLRELQERLETGVFYERTVTADMRALGVLLREALGEAA